MFTYVMKGGIEELIEEKLNQEFPSEVENERTKTLKVIKRSRQRLRRLMMTQNLIMKMLTTIWNLQIWQQIWRQQ